uniref:uncharacterized protein LOC109966582 n=1 Tax=Monopterus albus TaxID=43700 RepID=UPI0009B31787|nr:uncharacterized protein LOC109966582 [Monopterus albus]
MIRQATDVQESVLQGVFSPPLPADHVLNSGAVLFPGAFDQHGCHLIVFPVDGQAKLSSALSKAEVVHFINYFLCLYNKMQEKESLVSVVADLTHASLPTTRFIAETLLLLELHKRTIHTVYITKPLKKDVFKLLLKILAPSKSHAASFKRVFLKGIPELSNYIDKSQLTTSLGGYFIYSHQSWVAFIKEIDAFVLEFLSVVQQLPSFISALQALSRLPLPATFIELHHFSSTNKAKFQQLRRELGLDELLRHCESMVQKLRHPEMEPCYQAMAGTALFTHTAFDMLQNHSRITAAVEKVEMLLQQAFSKANLQLQVFQLQEDALLITEQIETLQEKLQPYKVEIAKDAAEGVNLVSQFEASIHTPAMALVRCAEDLIHTLAEILPFDDQSGEHWVLDLERLKEKLQSTVHIIVQTLRAVSNYHHCYNKANHWYSLVLCENFLQELLSGVTDRALPQQQRRNWESIPAWRHRLSTFLKKNPPPSMEELLYLAHLSIAIPDKEIQQKGKKMSQQCMILRKLLISSGPVAVSHVQLALQWQFELLRSSHVNLPSGDSATNITTKDVKDGPSEFGLTRCETAKESGFDGTMISQLKAGVGREGVEVLGKPDRTRDSGRPATPQIPKECVSGFEDDRLAFDFGSVENSSRANFQIIPKETMDFLNFEIQVNRSAALPSNPWLSLPIDNLEHSYTVTITQNPTPQQRDVDLYGLSDPHTNANRSDRSQDQPTQTELLSSIQSRDGILHSQSNLEDPEQSSIGDMLSSAITDVTEKSTYTTEGNHTLLWDSYDLHDQNRNPLDGVIDISLKDWDMKEQEGLTDVKKILDRTNEILEEEENILAQEAVLEALLRSEDEHNPWPLCDSEDHLCVMSSSKLSKAGVIGLKEDYFDPAKSNDLSDLRSTGSSSETKAPEDDAYCTGDATEADAVTFHSRLDLLTELREVHVLDKLFIEENLKICELWHCENPNNKLLGKKPSDTNGLSVSKEMEVFALQLEKEKGEVQKLEKSLDKEVVAKKHKDRAKKVVTCSIMEKARTDKEDRPLCDELLSGRCKTPQRTYQDQNEDTCKVENIQAELGSDVTEEASPPDDVPQCQDLTCFKADPTLHSEHMLNSTYDLKEPKPEISLTPEMRLHDGSLLPPVPKPRKASLPVNCSLREPKTHSPEQLNPALFSTAEDPGFVQLALQDEPLDALIENVTPWKR